MLSGVAFGQGFGDPSLPGPPRSPPPPPREAAPVDLTGYWVSVITEDYRYRMFTPARNDNSGVPLNDAGRARAAEWDPEADRENGDACRAYGVGGLMRMPTRLRIQWEDDDTLRIDSDHGEQTRLLHFDGPHWQPGDARTLQGDTAAEWDGRTLKAVTRNMTMGYVRRNGVPYSEQATVTEYFDLHGHDGETWFTVTTIVEDPVYLSGPFYTTSDFKQLPDGSDFDPQPCVSEWGPLRIMDDTDRFQ